MRVVSIGYRKIRAVECYLSLLVWLILVSVVIYWYLNQNGPSRIYHEEVLANGGESKIFTARVENIRISQEQETISQLGLLETSLKEFSSGEKPNTKELAENSVKKLCNPVDMIHAKDENIQVPDYKLEAIVIIFRHGVRGPLAHIGYRNVSAINCEAKEKKEDFDQLSKFATDTILKLQGYTQFIGPFHSFPKIPTSPFCSLGQLSQLGSGQLLALGKLINSTYQSTLLNNSLFKGDENQVVHPLKVIAYSTKYRRTFQSLFAFLYGFIGPKHLIQSTTIRESQSMIFCFKHCSCKAVDMLKKTANKKFRSNGGISKMGQIVTQLNSVLGTERSKKTGNSLLDSLLVYPCHNIELPCTSQNRTLRSRSIKTHPTSNKNAECVTNENMEKLIQLINQADEEFKIISESKKYHLLNAYGLMKEIMNLGLRMASESWRKHQHSQGDGQGAASTFTNGSPFNNDRAKVAVFSGHDLTMISMITALGLHSVSEHPEVHLPPFASRMIFEFYRRTTHPPNSPRKLYFRVIYNSQSITHLITFCKDNGNGTQKTVNRTLFCPIENLVRFIHENYFTSFNNSTNFKDACKE